MSIHVPPPLPLRKGLEFSQALSLRPKQFKEYKTKLDFAEEGGCLRKKSLPWGRYEYFLELHI